MFLIKVPDNNKFTRILLLGLCKMVFKAIMELFLPMGKQVPVKLLLWWETIKILNGKELFQEAFNI